MPDPRIPRMAAHLVPACRRLEADGIRPGDFVRVVGENVSVELEYNEHPEKIDHVWVGLEVPDYGRVRLSVNTRSQRNHLAGFDARVRVGVFREAFVETPVAGIFRCPGLDYGELETRHNVFYETFEQEPMETLLLGKLKNAPVVEAWGEIYLQSHIGIHQIHSRQASCAVETALTGRDGALRLYLPEQGCTEMLLFKFCGQS